MKKIIYKTLLGFSTISLVSPLTLTSCATEDFSKYQEIIDELKEVAIAEFQEICKIPHPTFNLGQIKEYLNQRIIDLGYMPSHDTYGNIWFDIPGTDGCEEWKKVIIQGHMDMVYAGTTPEAPIIPVIEEINDPKTQTLQKVMHSKDYKTSLGADDGIGLATMFAICKNKKLQHGPIRFIMTCDEEDGSKGAHSLPADVLDCNCLINVDGEVDCGLIIANYGTSSWKFPGSLGYEKLTESKDILELSIGNLHGGHSGEDVGFGYANAERIAFEILNQLIKNHPNSIQLIEINHKDEEGHEISYKPNALIRNAKVVFATNLSIGSIVEEIFNLMESFENKYFGENWNEVQIDVNDVAQDYAETNVITTEYSNKVIELLGDREKGFYCGLINILDKEKHVPGASSNIGPTILNANDEHDPDRFYTQTLGRSYLANDILVFSGADLPSEFANVTRSFTDIWFTTMGNDFGRPVDFSTKLAWESSTYNPIRDLLIDGYKKVVRVEPNLVSLYGVLEESEFIKKKPNINMVTIGPRLENCHTQMETLYIDSIDAEYAAIIYALEHYNTINNE